MSSVFKNSVHLFLNHGKLEIRGSNFQLTCVDNEGRARGMGLLPSGGFLFKTSLNLVRRILSPASQLLPLIGKDVKFEITCGVNGRVWIKSHNIKETNAIYRIIKDSEFVPEPDIPALVDKQIRLLRGFPVADEDIRDVHML